MKGDLPDPQLHNDLLKFKKNFFQLSEKANLILIDLDMDLKIKSWNSSAERIFGYKAYNAVSRNIGDLLVDAENQTGLVDFLHGIKKHSEKKIDIITKKVKKHDEIITHWYCVKVFDEKNNPSGISIIVQDITQFEMAKETLSHVEKDLHDIFGSAPIGIYQADIEGQFISANPELAWMLGYESAQILIREMSDMASQMFEAEENAEEFFFSLMEAEQLNRYRCKLKRKDGTTFWALSYAQVTRNDLGRIDGFYGFSIDITNTVRTERELKRVNEELKRLSIMDGLTQIANRRRFDECLHYEWKRLMREKNTLSLILSDIDFFKLFNDTYGHQAGDDCLQAVARVFRESVHRATDLVARYGGEEFVVILANTEPEGAVHIAEKIRKAVKSLNIPHSGSKTDKIVTISLGVSSVKPNSEQTPHDLIKKADEALYEAKDLGRDRHIYKKL